MKHILFTIALVVAFGLASLAQSTSPSDPSTGAQGTNPTTGSSSATTGSSGQYGSAGQSSTSTSGSMGQSSSSSTKGEKKLKGCIESQGGQYVLREKNGKEVNLAGSADFASHVGHQVTVHGTYEGSGYSSANDSSSEKMPSASGSTTANPTGSTSSSNGQQFTVNKIDHESDTCKVKGANTGMEPKSSTSGTNSSGTQAPDHQ